MKRLRQEEDEEQTSPFGSISNDPLQEIALRLPLSALSALCLTNTKFSRVCRSERFWAARSRQDFGSTTPKCGPTWLANYRIRFGNPPKNHVGLMDVATRRTWLLPFRLYLNLINGICGEASLVSGVVKNGGSTTSLGRRTNVDFPNTKLIFHGSDGIPRFASYVSSGPMDQVYFYSSGDGIKVVVNDQRNYASEVYIRVRGPVVASKAADWFGDSYVEALRDCPQWTKDGDGTDDQIIPWIESREKDMESFFEHFFCRCSATF